MSLELPFQIVKSTLFGTVKPNIPDEEILLYPYGFGIYVCMFYYEGFSIDAVFRDENNEIVLFEATIYKSREVYYYGRILWILRQ